MRRFHPPGPEQIQAARELLEALDQWEELPDTAGSRWAMKFVSWLGRYTTPVNSIMTKLRLTRRRDIRDGSAGAEEAPRSRFPGARAWLASAAYPLHS